MRKNDNAGDRNYMKERQKTINTYNNNKKLKIGIDDYRESKEQEIKRKKDLGPSRFLKDRKNILFKANYSIILLMTLLLIGNTIGRGFVGTYSYIIPNVLFIIIFLVCASYVNPINFSSDNKNYVYTTFNSLYLNLQKLTTQLLTRLGSNLNVRARSSLITSFVITVIGFIISLLFYNSNFEILAIPFFIIYVTRVFTSNSFRNEIKTLNLLKWILFMMLIINSIMSVFWKTPFDYTLFVIISIYNSTSIWFKNTYIYTNKEI